MLADCLIGILAADVISTFERWLCAEASALFAQKLEFLWNRFSIVSAHEAEQKNVNV